MPKYKAFKDQILKVTDVNVEVDNFEKKNPEIQKVRLSIPEKERDITVNLTTKEVERKKKVVDSKEIKAEQETKRNLYFNELPDIFIELAELTKGHDTQDVKATVTRGIPDDEDQEPFYFINQNHLKTLKILEDEENEDGDVDDDMPDDVKEIVEETQEEKRQQVFD